MTFRDSCTNLIRSDKPESPTDFVFIALSLTLCGLLIYVTQRQVNIPHLGEFLLFLTGVKGVKIAANWQKQKSGGKDESATDKPIGQN